MRRLCAEDVIGSRQEHVLAVSRGVRAPPLSLCADGPVVEWTRASRALRIRQPTIAPIGRSELGETQASSIHGASLGKELATNDFLYCVSTCLHTSKRPLPRHETRVPHRSVELPACHSFLRGSRVTSSATQRAPRSCPAWFTTRSAGGAGPTRAGVRQASRRGLHASAFGGPCVHVHTAAD